MWDRFGEGGGEGGELGPGEQLDIHPAPDRGRPQPDAATMYEQLDTQPACFCRNSEQLENAYPSLRRASKSTRVAGQAFGEIFVSLVFVKCSISSRAASAWLLTYGCSSCNALDTSLRP